MKDNIIKLWLLPAMFMFSGAAMSSAQDEVGKILEALDARETQLGVEIAAAEKKGVELPFGNVRVLAEKAACAGLKYNIVNNAATLNEIYGVHEAAGTTQGSVSSDLYVNLKIMHRDHLSYKTSNLGVCEVGSKLLDKILVDSSAPALAEFHKKYPGFKWKQGGGDSIE